jgi:hypothetical protein
MTLRPLISRLLRRAADRLDRPTKSDVARAVRVSRGLLSRYQNGPRNPKCSEANTARRHAEVGAFLERHQHITDFNRLAEIAVNEGLYSPNTSKCDIIGRLERFDSLHPSSLNPQPSNGELLRG